jgi:pimeloyl-ACP methyl ester carboxylesterase
MLGVLVAANLEKKVERLIILDATPHGLGTANEDPQTLLIGSFEDLVESVRSRVPNRSRESLVRGVRMNARMRQDGLWEWCWDPEFRNTSQLRASERELIWSKLLSLKVPITFVSGSKSEKISQDMVIELKTRVPKIQFFKAPGAGHNIHTDLPHWTARLINSLAEHNQTTKLVYRK